MTTCSILDCGYAVIARGWCHTHYKRWQVHGDPNYTKHNRPRDGVLAAFLASIPDDGDGCVIWPGTKNNMGYAMMKKNNKRLLVSRYMCERKNGPPPTIRHQAAHSCGNGHQACIAPWHLSWKTHKENMADMIGHGTRLRGEDVSNSILTEDQVREIKGLLPTTFQHRIAKCYGVTQTMISRIKLGKAWSHVQ